ncbi:TOBE domain-containing protein [Streptococcus suis]
MTLQLRLRAPAGDDGPILLARITRRSRDALSLHAGQQLFAQIKGVALIG